MGSLRGRAGMAFGGEEGWLVIDAFGPISILNSRGVARFPMLIYMLGGSLPYRNALIFTTLLLAKQRSTGIFMGCKCLCSSVWLDFRNCPEMRAHRHLI